MYRPLCLLIELRVGRISIFPLNLGFGSGLPRPRSLVVEPASDSSGFPASSALRLCRRSLFRLPQTLMPSALPVSAGFQVAPVAPTSSLRRLRYRSQVAPRSIPPALPVIDRRVASILAPSAVPAVKVPGCPFSSHFRYRRRSVSGSPRMLILRYRLTSFRVTSEPVPSGSPTDRISGSLRLLALGSSIDQFPGRPESWNLSMSPIPFVSSCPETYFLG